MHRWVEIYGKLAATAAEIHQEEAAENLEEDRVTALSKQQNLLSQGRKLSSEGQRWAEKDANEATSRDKPRIHWLASLITSGAIEGWEGFIGYKEEGLVMRLSRGADDGNQSTQHVLNDRFNKERPWNSSLPRWFTLDGLYLELMSAKSSPEDAVICSENKAGFAPPPRPA